MKKIIIIALLISVISIIGLSSVYAYESSNDNEKANNTLSEVQLQKLSELEEKATSLVGCYLYQQKVIVGEIDELDTRLDLQTVQEIISQNPNFNDILCELETKQTYPDFVGGSGVSILEYWFDDLGNEKIIIIYEQQEVYYTVLDNDGSIKTNEKLYSK